MSILHRIVNLFSRDRLHEEIDAELQAHLEIRAADNMASGMSEGEARRDALVRFGNRTSTRERVAGADSALLLSSVVSDLRFALRQLKMNPGFAATAIAVLAIGLGASVAIYVFVDAALIKPLPYRDPSRLVALFESMTLGARYHISYLDYVDWRRENQVFTSLDIYDGSSFELTTPLGHEQVDGAAVSDGFFRTLGVKPILGRDFHAGEQNPGSAHTALLSELVWRKRFGGREDVLGQAVTLSGMTYTIVGVLPADFHFAPVEDAGYWILTSPDDGCAKERGCHNMSGIARLKDGVSLDSAAAEMKQIADRIARQYPDADAERGATVLPLSDIIVGNLRTILLALLAGALLLLLIACANAASLLLVRAESRKREIAVRGALGASQARLIRQLLTEGLFLAAISSAVGVACAMIAVRLLLGLIPAAMMAGMPYLQNIGASPRVAGFAALLALCAALVVSLLPAMRLARAGDGTGLRDALMAGGRGFAGTLWRRFGANLVVLELTMAMVLLVCAGLLAKSLYRLLHTDIGIEPKHLAALHLTAPSNSYKDDAAVLSLQRQLLEKAKELAEVQAAAVSGSLPVGNHGGSTTFHVVGRPEHGARVEVMGRNIGQDYLRVVGARLLRGREFTADDDATHPQVMIINRSMAAVHFPGEDPIGKLVRYDATSPVMRIVGVVDDMQEGPLDTVNGPTMYTPFAQSVSNRFYLVVRSSAEGHALMETLSEIVKQAAPNVLVSQATTMSDRIHESPAAYLHRSSAWLVGGFAAMALLLGVIGLYGVIAYSVSQRTREIGVRMALGAARATVSAMVMKEAAWLIALGSGAGIVCSLGAAMLMRKLLFGTSPWDAGTVAAVAVVLAVAAMAASWIPAQRAASVNPVDALRSE